MSRQQKALARVTKCRNCGLIPIEHRKPDEDGHRRCPSADRMRWEETYFQFSPVDRKATLKRRGAE